MSSSENTTNPTAKVPPAGVVPAENTNTGATKTSKRSNENPESMEMKQDKAEQKTEKTSKKDKHHKKRKVTDIAADNVGDLKYQAELLFTNYGEKVLQKLITKGESIRTNLFKEIVRVAKAFGADLGLKQIAMSFYRFTPILRILRDIGLDLNHTDSLLLRWSVTQRQMTTVQFLLCNGADAASQGASALLDAYSPDKGARTTDLLLFQTLVSACTRFHSLPEKLLQKMVNNGDYRSLQSILALPIEDLSVPSNIVKKLIASNKTDVDALRLFVMYQPKSVACFHKEIYKCPAFLKDVELVSLLLEQGIVPDQSQYEEMASAMDPYCQLMIYETLEKMQE